MYGHSDQKYGRSRQKYRRSGQKYARSALADRRSPLMCGRSGQKYCRSRLKHALSHRQHTFSGDQHRPGRCQHGHRRRQHANSRPKYGLSCHQHRHRRCQHPRRRFQHAISRRLHARSGNQLIIAGGVCAAARKVMPVINGLVGPQDTSPDCRWIEGLAASGTGSPPAVGPGRRPVPSVVPKNLLTWAGCPCHVGQPSIGRCAPGRQTAIDCAGLFSAF
jgi:hypothetical protein